MFISQDTTREPSRISHFRITLEEALAFTLHPNMTGTDRDLLMQYDTPHPGMAAEVWDD